LAVGVLGIRGGMTSGAGQTGPVISHPGPRLVRVQHVKSESVVFGLCIMVQEFSSSLPKAFLFFCTRRLRWAWRLAGWARVKASSEATAWRGGQAGGREPSCKGHFLLDGLVP
jgi:hypothetical protein